MHQRIRAVRDGKEVEIPQDLEALVIETSKGGVYIDLAGPVPDMVLVRATHLDNNGAGDVRLILSPMSSGRMALGVINT